MFGIPQGVTDKKLRTSIKKQDKAVRRAAYENARSEVLQQHDAGYIEAEGTEQTRRFAQRDILGAVDENTRTKGFSLELNELGPYRCRWVVRCIRCFWGRESERERLIPLL